VEDQGSCFGARKNNLASSRKSWNFWASWAIHLVVLPLENVWFRLQEMGIFKKLRLYWNTIQGLQGTQHLVFEILHSITLQLRVTMRYFVVNLLSWAIIESSLLWWWWFYMFLDSFSLAWVWNWYQSEELSWSGNFIIPQMEFLGFICMVF